MGLQPSASKTALLLSCTRPFGPEIEIEADPPSVPMRYGSAFHEVLAAALRVYPKAFPAARYAKAVDAAAARYDVRGAAAELAGHVRGSLKVLSNWLDREKLAVEEVETSYAIVPGGAVRRIAPPDESHVYDIREGELPGTVDLIARGNKRAVILDHKTGSHDPGFARPSQLAQMRTLGLVRGDALVEVGILHADRQGLPNIYVEPFEEREAHAAALAAAMARIGDGSLRPGPHCGRCPARHDCPARSADILSEGTAALVDAANVLLDEPATPTALAPRGSVSLEARAAALYTLLKRFRALDKAGSAEIKRLVRAGALVEVEGGVLELRAESYETLSKASIVRALGKVEGEKLIEKLRARGVVETATREKMVPGKE
ncbi:MAG: PD-(D/E)XK nuclease family protein [Patescibacteria group bacterium]|nr:PD-(D/E)XK nuclease family protein [Patescibacteria group bacterium]